MYGQQKQYDNTNRVSLWNGDKSKDPKAPDLKGTVNINGTDYSIALWSNQQPSSAKSPVLTGQVQPKVAKQGGYSAQSNTGYNQAPVQPQANNGAPAAYQSAPNPAQPSYPPQQAPAQGWESDDIPF